MPRRLTDKKLECKINQEPPPIMSYQSGLLKSAARLLLCLLWLVPTALFADEAATSRHLEAARTNETLLIAFLKDLPKGADLHNHVTGAIYAESMLDAAVRSNLRFDPATGAFTTNPTNTVPAGALTNDTTLMRKFLDRASMRGSYQDVSGHDLFFDAFANFGPALGQLDYAQMLAEVVKRAKWQHIQYLELMTAVAPADALARAKSGLVITNEDWEQALATLKTRFPDLQTAAKAWLDRLDQDVAVQAEEPPPITESTPTKIRYIYSLSRTGKSTTDFFAGIACGMAIMQADHRVVAINIVAPEDDYYARQNFEVQMRMIDFLWQRLGRPNLTLHAGELTLECSPVEVMRSRIRKTIELGHARRIGHGVSIAWEDDLPGLLSNMRSQGIAVEICLTSNEGILKVAGDRHPLALYRAAGVPFTLNTDDEGVNRSNLTMEFVKAVRTFNIRYPELKNIVRNSLEYSFLPGTSLYVDRDYQRVRPEFKRIRKETWQPSDPAKSLLDQSEKLREEVRLERALVEFEQQNQ